MRKLPTGEFYGVPYQKISLANDRLKAKIGIQSLLTMSSGLDAIDNGINANPKSLAVEDNF